MPSETKSEWIQIHYDYIPKYSMKYCLQGRDKSSRWNIHLELHEAKREEKEEVDNTQLRSG